MNEILQVAMLAGQMILENGGETYRVEETIWRICKIYGPEEQHGDNRAAYGK